MGGSQSGLSSYGNILSRHVIMYSNQYQYYWR